VPVLVISASTKDALVAATDQGLGIGGGTRARDETDIAERERPAALVPNRDSLDRLA
jgi:hypothetical protein